MYYSNYKDHENAPIAFYEIYRNHTSAGRDAGYSPNFVLGTTDTVEEAIKIIETLQGKSDDIIRRREGYHNTWIEISPGVTQSTNKWTDEIGYMDALNEFRKIDPSYNSGDNPKYFYNAVRRLPLMNIGE